MPTNLNALIRYKQIDACIKNPYVRCTIDKLREVCTEALGESRGIYKLVSERTIRDDIRVMRSNILGFNAPIEFENGAYIYTDKDYSIFKTPVSEIKLLKDIFMMLISERKGIADSEIDNLLKRIALIVGEPLPEKEEKEKLDETITIGVSYSIAPPNEEIIFAPPEPDEFPNISLEDEIPSIMQESEPLLMWNEILRVL